MVKSSRWQTVSFVIALATLAPNAGALADPAARPNILLICIDALRADHLGVYGAAAGRSPSLDSLAAEGVVFEQATSVASWTKPSVVSLLTGLYPTQHGVMRASRKKVDVLGAAAETVAETLQASGYSTVAFVQNDHLQKRSSGLDQGFDLYVDDAGVAPVLTHRFLSWLEASTSQPFFAYLHYLDPHWPYVSDVVPAALALTPAEAMRAAGWGLREEHWWLLRERVNAGKLKLDDAGLRILEKLYAAEVFSIDAVLGRMFRLLRAAGVLEHTLLIVTADHGEGFLEHASLDHGYGLYDELLRLPLLARFPAGEYGGRRVAAQVQSVDIVPTLIDVAGLPPRPELPGQSLIPLLAGKVASVRDYSFSEEVHGRSRTFSVRSADRKYIRTTRPAGVTSPPPAVWPADVRPGVRLQAEGIYAGGELVAAQVKKIGAGDMDCEVAGPLGVVAGAATQFRLLDYPLDLPESWRSLAAGTWVRVEGELEDGVLRARKVRELFDVGSQEIEVEGVVSAVGGVESGDVWIELCGRKVIVDVEADWEKFQRPGAVENRRVAGTARPESVVEELYRLDADPSEQRNRADGDAAALAKLRGVAMGWQKSLAPVGAGSGAVLDDATRERLRALGYLDE